MALTETQIRQLEPDAKSYQCSDGRGLFLEIHPNGSKLWRFKYRFLGKQKRLALGRYPDVGLEGARRKLDEARQVAESTIAAAIGRSVLRCTNGGATIWTSCAGRHRLSTNSLLDRGGSRRVQPITSLPGSHIDSDD